MISSLQTTVPSIQDIDWKSFALKQSLNYLLLCYHTLIYFGAGFSKLALNNVQIRPIAIIITDLEY